MSHRVFNAFSETQANFGTSFSGDYGGWSLAAGSADLFFDNIAFYNRYVPGDDYESTYSGNSLRVKSSAIQSSVVIESPFVDGVEGRNYLISLAVGSTVDGEAVMTVDYYKSNTDTSPVASTESQKIILSAAKYGRVYQGFTAAAGLVNGSPMLMKVKITFSGPNAANLAVDDTMVLYDPVVCEDHYSGYGRLSYLFYTDLPEFMRIDDQNIADIVKSDQIPFPLKRFVESLAHVADDITEKVVDFEYTRPTEGTESKSTLTDPDTADVPYLFWLASITATTLLSASSGFTPWIALETNDPVSPVSPGQWTDWEAFVDWLDLQTLNPDFFNSVQGFRDQIRTGFSGINAGRLDVIESYLETLLDTSELELYSVEALPNDKDNPFLLSLLVDPTVDPDPNGTLLVDAVNKSLSAGSAASKISVAKDSGEASYDFSTLVYPATHSDAAAGGAVVYGRSFVSDYNHHGRNLLLSEPTLSTVGELGGGVGAAHYSDGSQYYYGETSLSTYGSLTTSAAPILDLGGSTAGYDLIFVVTDLTVPSAAVDTAGDGGNTPADWLYREKRLLACGTDSGGANNDWAVYLVSGHTPSAEQDVRLMLVDGYEAVDAFNYAVSDPIDFSNIGVLGQYVFRVSRSAVSGTATVSFYAQPTLYGDWESNSVGTATFTPKSSAATTGAGIQILGELNATDNWADAEPVTCGLKRFMLYNSPVVFEGESDTSATAHAYVNGEASSDFGVYEYLPTLDIDLSGVPVYSDSFTATASDTTSVTVTVNQAATNDLDVLAMRQLSGADVWYFGAAASAGDELSIDGLAASTAYRVIPTIVDTATGSTSTSDFTDFTTDGSGVLTITAQDAYDGGSALYQGITVTQIDVQPSGGGASVATFLPSTILSSLPTGTDSVNAANTWTLTRNYPGSSAVAYAPSQIIDRDFLHMYEGSPGMFNPPEIETHSAFSVLFLIRRFWTTGTYDIFRLENASGQGLSVFYEDGAVKASFTDGVDTETVSWTESPSFGDWHWCVVRRDPVNGLGLLIDGGVNYSEFTAAASVVSTFTAATDSVRFGQGAAGEFNARFGLADFAYFDRRLSDIELGLLKSELPAPFSVLDLSPVLWVDAADTSTIVEDPVGSGSVSEWQDKSGNGYDLTQGTGVRQPTTGTRTLNGLNVLDFDGSLDYMQATYGAAISQPLTIFAIAQNDDPTAISNLWAGITTAANASLMFLGNVGRHWIYGGTTLLQWFVAPDGNRNLYRVTYDGASTSFAINGDVKITGTVGTNSPTGLRIGVNPDLDYPFNGVVGEVIVVEGALTADQISQTETYLAKKWGITL